MSSERKLRYIAVDGPIGAGKTTLCKMLAEEFHCKLILEPALKNPFLPEFYENPKKNAFKTQLFFLLNRYQQQLELKQQELFNQLVICDYTFEKDVIFAKLNLSADEQNLYFTMYDMLAKKLPHPDLVIYLRADISVMMDRIKMRGLKYENAIDKEYLEELSSTYNQHFSDYHETPLLIVDSSFVNYEKNPEDFATLKREILGHRGGTSYLIAR
ncbi:MAG: deoxynucleoside kinase [Deltaproteobacteria bacterium CG11_big_fil_rev_8_21_14_0_20_42_23]|nr:MAG: deoxynucleoside kinase [Deltaproteobacteria bacterium CG11_big_fil_rev_8_21_14_0_20_42_23]PJC64864.1 MAG: deoxynucleoside kinase [Deltaproteobacteria bacterium CG_4_9_14_0_2_um_filter_42_21]